LYSRQKGGLAGILDFAREIAPVVVLHVPKTIHMSQTVDVSRDHGFGRVEIEHVFVEGWKNSSNAVLYLERLSAGEGAVERSDVKSDVGSNATETICVITYLISS
jgi:hypothetical protein